MCKTRWGCPKEHRHPRQAMAVPIPKGTAILLIVIRLSLNPQQLLPLFLELPSQTPFTAFHLSFLLPLSTIFFLSLGTQVGQVISFKIVFSWRCVSHNRLSLRCGAKSFSSTMIAMFFESGQFFLSTSVSKNNCHGSTFLPPHCLHNVALSAPLHECEWFYALAPRFLVLYRQHFSFSQFLFCVPSSGSHYPTQKWRMFWWSASAWHMALLLVQSSLPAHTVASLSQTHPRSCQPHSSFFGCTGRLSFQMLALTATVSCFSNLKPASMYWSPHQVFVTVTSFTSPHTFGDHFRQKGLFHVYPFFLANPTVLVQWFAHVSSSFLKRN